MFPTLQRNSITAGKNDDKKQVRFKTMTSLIQQQTIKLQYLFLESTNRFERITHEMFFINLCASLSINENHYICLIKDYRDSAFFVTDQENIKEIYTSLDLRFFKGKEMLRIYPEILYFSGNAIVPHYNKSLQDILYSKPKYRTYSCSDGFIFSGAIKLVLYHISQSCFLPLYAILLTVLIEDGEDFLCLYYFELDLVILKLSRKQKELIKPLMRNIKISFLVNDIIIIDSEEELSLIFKSLENNSKLIISLNQVNMINCYNLIPLPNKSNVGTKEFLNSVRKMQKNSFETLARSKFQI